MSIITEQLAEILSTVRRPGLFYASGRIEMFAPQIEVEGVGPIALPLLPMQVAPLIAAAERAPFGRGPETLVDTSVRRTWQIAPDQVRIGGKHWPRTIADIVARSAAGLGVTEPVAAEFYKMLVYDAGSFFVSHRDTEKSPGMFATLVVALPSRSTGGELVVRHKGAEARLDLRCEEPCEAAFAAFYADCLHEVLTVTSGCRITLVYNLIRTGTGAPPAPPSYTAEAATATAALQSWVAGWDAPDEAVPKKLVYPLAHAYTPAELGFATLKGADAAIAQMLTTAAPEAACALHLALLTITEHGSAEYRGDYRSRYDRSRGNTTPEFEVIEILDGSQTLSDWVRPDGVATALGAIPIEDDEIAPPQALADLTPDEQEFSEATGNAGASFERTYRRAALVLWPQAQTLAVLNQAGLAATLPYLADLLLRWHADGSPAHGPLRAEARTLARHMIATWPERGWWSHDDRKPSELAGMLTLLAQFKDTGAIDALLDRMIAQNAHNTGDNDGLLTALAVLPTARATKRLTQIVAAHAARAPAACAGLLVGAVRGRFARRPAALRDPVVALVAALPGDPARAPLDQYARPIVVRPTVGLVVDVLSIVDRVDPALAADAAAYLLAWPEAYDPDKILVPALRRLIETGGALGEGALREGPAQAAVRAACLAHLTSRANEPLAPPANWARPDTVRCTCAPCAELGRFLKDAALPTWSLKAVQAVRDHVETTIRTAACDVATRTERRGSPHTLVCTKTQASYERRVVQRQQDLADLALLAT